MKEYRLNYINRPTTITKKQYYGCYRKNIFNSMRTARVEAERIKIENPPNYGSDRVEAYKCLFCPYYHIGKAKMPRKEHTYLVERAIDEVSQLIQYYHIIRLLEGDSIEGRIANSLFHRNEKILELITNNKTHLTSKGYWNIHKVYKKIIGGLDS